jgi:hypothetical protein
MRKIREILRLAWSCNQTRQSISDSCGIGKTTVTDTLYRASAAGLSYPLLADLDDERLERLLYPQHSRTIHSAYKVELKGESMRKKHCLQKIKNMTI